jgi:class 3 adenylate cyclase/CheY-like chemotaxis protein
VRKILVIEDETHLREDISSILELENFEVVAAENGKIGLERAREHKPDLILSDVMMPELDGFAVLEQLRQDPTTYMIPLIFLTAKTDRTSMRRGMGIGADDYLTKPFTSVELIEAINVRLARQDVILQEINYRLAEIDLLRQVDQELTYRLSPDWIMTLAMDWALRRTSAHAAFLGIIDEDDPKSINIQHATSDDSASPKVGDKLPAQGKINEIIVKAHPIQIADYEKLDAEPFTPKMQSMLGVPLLTQDGVIGVILLESRKPDAFNQDDAAFLVQMANRAAIALQHANLFRRLMRQQERELKLRETFGRFVSQEIENAIYDGNISLTGETRIVTVLFCDIRGFTTFSESRTPEQVVGLLNEYLSIVVTAAQNNGGVVNKFGGDSVLVVYGVPVQIKNSAYSALMTALEIRKELAVLNERRKKQDEPPILLGIGVNTGKVIAGAVGPESRQEYTVIGDTVNLASRIEALNKDYPQYDILMSEQARDSLDKFADKFEFADLGALDIRGKSDPVRIFALTKGPDAE